MSWKFVIPSSGNKIAGLGVVKGVDDSYELATGVSRAKGFSVGAYMEMNPRFPKQIALGDSFSTIDSVWVASQRLTELVVKFTPKELETLPITIRDHKGRDVDIPYFLINPLRTVDAIDQSQSKFRWNPINKDFIASFQRLVMDESKLPVDAGVCRIKHIAGAILVAPALIEAIVSARMNGLRWEAIEDYTG
jgi:hypothetical protein